MVPNQMKAGWARPLFAVLGIAGLLVLAGCGGGSGAPNNPFTPPPPTVGPVFVLPTTTTVYAHTPATLSVSGGQPPYTAFSANSAVLPVASSVSTGTIVLLANDVTAATSVDVTVQDALGQIAKSTVTVQPAPLFGTLTVVPSLTTCGSNAICSGGTGTATVQVTGIAGAPLPNRQVRYDVVSGAFGIQSSNPATPLVSTLTVVSDASGFARVTIQATVNAPTQPAIIKATDLTTGNEVQASFTIVQQTDGSTILSITPTTATITGPDTVTCSAGFRTDYFIYGGTPPYTVSSTFPAAITLINPVVNTAGGFFEAITNGSCVNPLVFTIVDSTGRTTTATLINTIGTTVPPTPVAPAALVITPTTQTINGCTATTGRTCRIAISGGNPPYNIFVTPNTFGNTQTVLINQVSTNITDITVPRDATYTVGVVDSGAPQKAVSGTLICSTSP
jgi:hypothetical protein